MSISSAATKSKPKPKPKPKPADNRVLSDVLLAIKAKHPADIAAQQKNHEYRKYRLRDGVERLWGYETGEGSGRSAITSG